MTTRNDDSIDMYIEKVCITVADKQKDYGPAYLSIGVDGKVKHLYTANPALKRNMVQGYKACKDKVSSNIARLLLGATLLGGALGAYGMRLYDESQQRQDPVQHVTYK